MQSILTTLNQDKVYMDFANSIAALSKAKRKQVGAALVTKNNVVLTGYNGTPSGTCNICEDEVDSVLVTKPEVIHAELNCIMKAAKEGISVIDSIIYITLAPCLPCAAMLKQAGVKAVMYSESYRDMRGVEYLQKYNIPVIKFEG